MTSDPTTIPPADNTPRPDDMLDFDALVHLMRQVAHDMRGPLGALTGTADMLVSGTYGELSVKQERAAARIQRNSYRVLALLDDLMLYIKAEAGQLDAQPEPFNPRAILESLSAEVLPEATNHALTVTLTGLDELPETLAAPPSMIRRVIQELMWNAVNFSSSGEISISTAWQQDTATWTVRVRDCGPGIKPEHTSHIFKPLWRGEARFQGLMKTSGFGMGLATAQSLSRLMGGKLELTETSATGSTFTLCLPCQPQTQQ